MHNTLLMILSVLRTASHPTVVVLTKQLVRTSWLVQLVVSGCVKEVGEMKQQCTRFGPRWRVGPSSGDAGRGICLQVEATAGMPIIILTLMLSYRHFCVSTHNLVRKTRYDLFIVHYNIEHVTCSYDVMQPSVHIQRHHYCWQCGGVASRVILEPALQAEQAAFDSQQDQHPCSCLRKLFMTVVSWHGCVISSSWLTNDHCQTVSWCHSQPCSIAAWRQYLACLC